MHHPVRKAKKFRLQYDEDGECFVDDIFNRRSQGNVRVSHKYYWDDWGRRHKSFWQQDFNPLMKYINSRVGDIWDDVWSDICRKVGKGYRGEYARERVLRHVEVNADIVDGNVVDSKGRAIKYYDLYVHPVSGLLCKVEHKKKYKYIPPKLEWKFEDGAVFCKKEDKQKKETFTNWFKRISYEFKGKESYSTLKFGPHHKYNYSKKCFEIVNGWHYVVEWRDVMKTGYKFVSASKKDIRNYKLEK